MGDFLGVLSEEQADAILRRINVLLDEIRPDCVALSDAFFYINVSEHADDETPRTRAGLYSPPTLFLATFRGILTANAEGYIESKGSIGKGADSI